MGPRPRPAESLTRHLLDPEAGFHGWRVRVCFPILLPMKIIHLSQTARQMVVLLTSLAHALKTSIVSNSVPLGVDLAVGYLVTPG